VSSQTPQLDFFDTHPYHFGYIVLTGRRVRQWDTENQFRIRVRTIVAVESEWRNRMVKGVTERRSQTGSICSGERALDSCPSMRCQGVAHRTRCAGSRVRIFEDEELKELTPSHSYI
jgi:hypothetical protein